MFTGYFARIRLYTRSNLIPVSIARYTPRWYLGKCYNELAPSKELLKLYNLHHITNDEYTTKFLEYLHTLDVDTVLRDLQLIGNLNDIILICYEKPSDFCHRHLVAKWLEDNSNLSSIKEFTDAK